MFTIHMVPRVYHNEDGDTRIEKRTYYEIIDISNWDYDKAFIECKGRDKTLYIRKDNIDFMEESLN